MIFNVPKPQTAIFIPTLARAHALARVIANIREATPQNLFSIYFIAESSDQETIDTVIKSGIRLIINQGKPCYAGAINTAYARTKEPFFFTGSDDLKFHANWLQNAMFHMTDKKGVIGTNDLGQIPIGEARNSTHYLVKRKYIEEQSGVIDITNCVLYPYEHNYTDTEFTQTAMSRGAYDYAEDSLVEHLHPVWGKSDWDETYKRGQLTSNKDLQTFQSRRHLWSS